MDGAKEVYNSAIDIWLDKNKDLGATLPDTEVMIWPFRNNQMPLGRYVETVTINGKSWDVHWQPKDGHDKQAIAFITADKATNIKRMNWKLNPFFNYIIKKKWLDNSYYVLGVEAGHEVHRTIGGAVTRKYSVTVS